MLRSGGSCVIRAIRKGLADELGNACSTSAPASTGSVGLAGYATGAAVARGVPAGLPWPELPSALTAIIGTRQRLGNKGTAALGTFVRASRRLYQEGNHLAEARRIRETCNRAYINILSSLSCAPKAQKVILGLPLLVHGLSTAKEASCYTAQSVGVARGGSKKSYPSTGLVQKNVKRAVVLFYHKVSLMLRGMYLVGLFLPILIGAPLSLHFDIGRATWNKMVRRALELAGPAFVKWGQWASTRRDMFPGDLCEELECLYTCVPSHKYAHTKKLVEAAFGQRMEDMFEWFEEEPCASGSIAQVHKAKLSDQGARLIDAKGDQRGNVVAVKVRHPNVEHKLLRDFELMLIMADVADEIGDMHVIGESVRQFRGPLLEQLDLEHEAEALCRFNKNFRKNKDVSFPMPLYPYVSNDVLVETFEEGIMFSEIFGNGTHPWNRRLAQMGLNTLFKMLLEDNFVHADLHPGNILIRFKEPDFWARVHASFFGYKEAVPRPHITLLDTGMSTSLAAQDRKTLYDFFESISALDGAYVAETSLKMSTKPLDAQSFPSKPQFVHEIEELFKDFRAYMAANDDLPPAADCMVSLLDIFRKHRVGMKSELSVVIATVFMMEGWASQLDPDLKVMKTMRNFSNYNFATSFTTLCTA